MNDPFSIPRNDVPSTETAGPETPSETPPVFAYEDEADSGARGACITIGIIVLILLVVGIGTWYYISHRNGGTNGGDSGKDFIVPDSTSIIKNGGLVSAKNGGDVQYTDSAGRMVQVIIPAGALKEDTKISIEWVSSGRVTDLYHLKPDGLKFLKPVKVVIPYKESGLAKGETPKDIQLEYWFRDAYSDKKLLEFSVDKVKKTLAATVEAF